MTTNRVPIDRTPRVVVVDDHLLLSTLLVERLTHSGLDTTAVFAVDAEALLARLRELAPAIVLLDDHLGPLGDSVRLIGPCIELGALVIILAGSDDRILHARCIEEGAAGIVRKNSRPSEVVTAVGKVLDGSSLLTPAERTELIVDLRRARSEARRLRAPFEALTERESQVLEAICRGESASDISGVWGVSVATVRSHIRSVLVKLGAGSQLEAAAMARRAGWPWEEELESSVAMVATS